MKAYRGNGSTVPLDESGWLSTPLPPNILPPGKNPGTH